MRALTAAVVATILFVAPSLALEKAAARLHDSGRTDWSRAFGTVTIYYYNFCTGWVWVWSNWAAGDVAGVVVEEPCATNWNSLTGTRVFVDATVPSGYGYTGLLSVSEADAEGCPDVLLGQRPFLPTSGWNEQEWSIPWPRHQDLIVTVSAGGMGSPLALVTDHPAARGAEPPACGTCYPSTRENWSYYFGSTTSPLCPGSPFNDGVCHAQLLFDVVAFCNDTHSPVTPMSWGSIKGLYR